MYRVRSSMGYEVTSEAKFDPSSAASSSLHDDGTLYDSLTRWLGRIQNELAINDRESP